MKAALFSAAVFLLLATNPAAAQHCDDELPGRLFGWYGDESGTVLVYPPAKGVIGVFDRQARRTATADAISEAGVAALSDDRTAAFRLNGCESPSVVHLSGKGTDRTLARLPDPYALHPLSYDNDGIELAALHFEPAAARGGLVMIHGSGDSDRDNGAYLAIADALARSGLSVVDKRGAGASGGDWREAGFHSLAEDTLAGVTTLEQRLKGGVPVGVLGISQGGWVAAIAAGESDAVDFAITIVAPAVTLRDQQLFVIENLAADAGLGEALERQLVELARAGANYSLEGGDSNWEAYIQRRQALNETEAAPLLASLPDTREHWMWRWGRKVLDVDPVEWWSEYQNPLLAVFGEQDVYVSAERSARRLSSAAPQADIYVLEGLGHALAGPDTGVLVDRVLEILIEWTQRRIPAKQHRQLDKR